MVRKVSFDADGNKISKLPGKTIMESYGKEYGTDTIEIMDGLLQPGDNVLIIDDLIATGGSAKAAADLAEKCGAVVKGCVTILDVPELRDQAKKKMNKIPIYVVLSSELD